MVRKKSISSKVKTRKEAYKRRQEVRSTSISRPWRILIVTMKACKKFLSLRHSVKNDSCMQTTMNISQSDLTNSNYVNDRNSNDKAVTLSNTTELRTEFDDQNVIENIIKKIVSRVSRLDNERKRQLKNRKKKK
ncbi:unnamed protein product [Rotaria magnacalcarata]|uniref:Uncharacterized protein n=1 Tax=Rotaria magnacalcarata TaxID=392030 RepID=A0A820M0Z0_9BILA|nr:unnamed protein product [Rotaria magnacalcarata]CAF4365333.1 unnamed protein product [Rotaria magnacalcarata]